MQLKKMMNMTVYLQRSIGDGNQVADIIQGHGTDTCYVEQLIDVSEGTVLPAVSDYRLSAPFADAGQSGQQPGRRC